MYATQDTELTAPASLAPFSALLEGYCSKAHRLLRGLPFFPLFRSAQASIPFQWSRNCLLICLTTWPALLLINWLPHSCSWHATSICLEDHKKGQVKEISIAVMWLCFYPAMGTSGNLDPTKYPRYFWSSQTQYGDMGKTLWYQKSWSYLRK